MRLLAVLAALPLAACSFHTDGAAAGRAADAHGSGSARRFAVADFEGVDLPGSDDVDIRIGTVFSVRAEEPSAELDTLRVDRRGDTLRIGRTNGGGFDWGTPRR